MENLEPYFRVEYFLADAIEAAKNRGGGGGPTPGPTPPEPTPEPPDPNADVLFYDYDGTITNSYTAQEFAALTAMPANPTHQGLTAQGWNWSLADAKDYVSKYGMLDIGQMYITDDGKTRIYIHLTEGRTSPMLGLGVNGSVVVDWGDNSTETLTGSNVSAVVWTEKHNYASAGDYVITLTVTGTAAIVGDDAITEDGSSLLRNSAQKESTNSLYISSITKVNVGANVSIGESAFGKCSGLTTVSLPSSVTTLQRSAFMYAGSMECVTIPTGVSNIPASCFAYSQIKKISLPKSVETLSLYSFLNAEALLRMAIPPLVTQISNTTFWDAKGIKKITIPDGVTSIGGIDGCISLTALSIPSSVANIVGTAFQGDTGLASIKFYGTTPPSVETSYAFQNIPTDCIIYVPSGSLTAYTSATNYPDPATYQYVEY